MSANNNTTYMIQRDLLPVIKGKYWYKLSFNPIMDSLTIRFDLERGQTETVHTDFFYNYRTVETDCLKSDVEFKVYTVISADTLPYTDNGINYIPVTSQESQIFAMSLVGTKTIKDGKLINITRENYLQYIENLIGCSFIDFSVSNQIKQVLNATNVTSECEQVDISYFYEVLHEEE